MDMDLNLTVVTTKPPVKTGGFLLDVDYFVAGTPPVKSLTAATAPNTLEAS